MSRNTDPYTVAYILILTLILFGFSACSSLNSLSVTPQVDSESSPVDPSMVRTEQSQVTHPISTASSIPEDHPITTDLVTSVESYISYEFIDDGELLHGTYLVFQVYSRLENSPVEVELVSWEGDRIPYLYVEHIDPNDQIIDRFEAVRLNSSEDPYLLLPFGEYGGGNPELFIFRISDGSIWALTNACESWSSAVIIPGAEDIAFRCYEENGRWYFLNPIETEPTRYYDLPIIGTRSNRFDAEWIDTRSLIFRESFHHELCYANLDNWVPVCQEFDFWLGPLSPDRQWFEVRFGEEMHPLAIGVLNIECLIDEHVRCVAVRHLFPPEIAPSGTGRYLVASTWLPDSSGFLYNVFNTVEESTEFWRFNLHDEEFDFVGEYSGRYDFGSYYFDVVTYPPPWSPDGSSVVVSVGEQYYLLNIETGDLTPLTEGGVLLGAITLP